MPKRKYNLFPEKPPSAKSLSVSVHSLRNSGKKTVIVICGPTAVGKTALAIRLAEKAGTSIISADSRQCYRELNIGVARPSPGELERVPHYFIATHSIQEEVTAAAFEQYALQKSKALFREKDTVIMAGGTGLYIRAFCEGLDDIPEVPATVREQVISDYREKGLHWLQEEIRSKDPLFYQSGEIQNPQRMMRALEVLTATGRSVLSFRKGLKAERDFQIIRIGLELSREELNRRIDTRVDAMIAAGLVDEVKGLMDHRHRNALQTVGYAEILDYLIGKTSLDEAVSLIKIHTRQYAKRQMTWFKKDPLIQWFGAGSAESVNVLLEEVLIGRERET